MPRRALIFSTVFYPHLVGGAEVAVKEVTDRIPPNEIEFDMVTLRMHSDLPKFERIGNINVYRIGWSAKRKGSTIPWHTNLNKYYFVIGAFFKALSLHRKRRYGTIWSIMASYNSFAAVLFKMASKKVRFVLTLQEGDPTEHMEKRAKPLWPLFKAIFKRADYIQAISSFLAKWAEKMGATCEIKVVPNAVDLDLFTKKINEREALALREKLGKKETDFILVTTSRLVEKNAVGDVIDALVYLPKYVSFIILGEGKQEKELREKCLKSKLEDRVTFLGYVPHKELPQFLKISDVFIRPSRSEGLGNSFLEAMASGIPVIATPVGGIPDFLIDGETGLFCETGNPKSIAQKVEKIMKDGQSRDYIVGRAFDMVNRRYVWEGVAESIKKILIG